MAKISKPAGIGNRFVVGIVDKDGNTRVEAHGFANGECIKATSSYEQALGKGGQRVMTGGACQQEHQSTGN